VEGTSCGEGSPVGTLSHAEKIIVYHDIAFSETHYKDLRWLDKHDQRNPPFEPPRLTNLG
ncbi:MAG: hypothetical protein ACUVWY_09615, partial [Desulfosoma sp.]|uniref:hypothetical protein n=1 Tax=Desulfosoma sp. TaxID=2603217 RepID=UPI00404A51DD